MQPRRSLRLHQFNNGTASVSATSTPKPNITKKRVHVKNIADTDIIQPKEKKIKSNDDKNDTLSLISMSSIKSDVLQLMPVEIVVGYEFNGIESLLKNLSNLHHLRISIVKGSFLPLNFSKILPLLREYSSVEIITISLDDTHDLIQLFQFYKEFIETITAVRKSNARIEVEESGKIIGSFTENGIVWRNKLLHWTNCDKIPDLPNKHLLNLANQPEKSDVGRKRIAKRGRNTLQWNLLDRIFDYLDITSLYLFAEASPRSKQLVENYIKRYSKQNGTFTMTNEFYSMGHFTSMHKMFAPHVNNLIVHGPIYSGAGYIFTFNRLKTVSVSDTRIVKFLPPSVRHLIYDGSEIINCPNLHKLDHFHTLELKNAGLFNEVNYDKKYVVKCWWSRKFIFNYRDETQFENLKRIFKHSYTELVPVYPNFNQI